MTKPKVRPEKRGFGYPIPADGSDDVLLLPTSCLSCGEPIIPVCRAPGADHVLIRIAFVCSRPNCGAQWIFTGTFREMKSHQLQTMLEVVEAQKKAERKTIRPASTRPIGSR